MTFQNGTTAPTQPQTGLGTGRALAVALILALLAALHVTVSAPAAQATTLPPGFVEMRVPGLLDFPTSLAVAPDGRVFVGDRKGVLRVFKDDVLLPDPVLTVTVSVSGERGLVGITFDPDFATNNYIYIYYTAVEPTIHNRVSRFTLDGDVAVAGSEQIIFELDTVTHDQHNGGAMEFGPDGKLYIATGDDFHSANAQTLDNTFGKVLRINADGSIPTDNPFYGAAGGNNRAIWALGFRNPFTFDIQPGTGRMYINDVGAVSYEEINEGVAGSNYGWPVTEGPTDDDRYRSPVYGYGHSWTHGEGPETGCAITGGSFYNPVSPQFPAEYLGKYFYIDYCSRWINTYDPATGEVATFASGLDVWNTIYTTTAPDGSLYYLTAADLDGKGGLFKINYTGSLAPQIGKHPEDRLVTVGQAATFSVDAYGDDPLSYQWQANGADISGATSPTYTTPPTDLSNDGIRYRVVVSNAHGTTMTNEALLTVTNNAAPVPTIASPADGSYYTGGQTISFSGSGSDAEDGAVPPSAMEWQIDLHHNTHVHPGVFGVSGVESGTWTVPDGGEASTNVFYRFKLTVTDSQGRSATTYHDIRPTLSQISLATSPKGLSLALDGLSVNTPYTEPAVVGLKRTLSAPATQNVNGVVHEFVSWSDGGPREHTITTPPSPVTYTATYRVRSTGSISATPNPIYEPTGTGTATLNWDSQGPSTVEVRIGSPNGNLLSRTGPGPRSATTGKWVTDGMQFFLQDVTGLPTDQERTADGTLASVTVKVVKANGEIGLNPNPITVPWGTTVATTTVRWGTNRNVEIRLDGPNGKRFSASGPGNHQATTGNWVRNGMVFYLVDWTSTSTRGTTIDSVNARVRSATIAASPNPAMADLDGYGQTTLQWSAAGVDLVEIRVGSPGGPLFSRSTAGTWQAQTGQWVRDGMVFYVQDVTGGAPLTAANTLAIVRVGVTATATATATWTATATATAAGPSLMPTKKLPKVTFVRPTKLPHKAPKQQAGERIRSTAPRPWMRDF